MAGSLSRKETCLSASLGGGEGDPVAVVKKRLNREKEEEE